MNMQDSPIAKLLVERLKAEGIAPLPECANEFTKEDAKLLCSFFAGLSYKALLQGSITEEDAKTAQIHQLIPKLRFLDAYLKECESDSLAAILSISEKEAGELLAGKRPIGRIALRRAARYFHLEARDLLNDDVSLPKKEDLTIDQTIKASRKENAERKNGLFEHKHFLTRNYQILNSKKKTSLLLSILLVAIPLLSFSIYAISAVTLEKNDDLQKYVEGSEATLYDTHSDSQTALHDELEETSVTNDANAIYCPITVGTTLYRIYDITPGSSSYKAQLELYFTFDKESFQTMFAEYAKDALMEEVLASYGSDTTETYDEFIANHQTFFDNWVKENDRNYYPAEVSVNDPSMQTMFKIGNGSIVPDTVTYLKKIEEVQRDDGGVTCYQSLSLDAEFVKSFDSIRYPLDSVQFKMYIQPTMDAHYIRYVPDLSVDSEGNLVSGYSPYFKLTSGYRLINETDDIKNFSLRLNYYESGNSDPALSAFDTTIRTQLEIVCRANRQGVSLFLKAFMNLFAVMIWIAIAFYNQSHNGENAIGMLGTGLFGLISSILVGLSLVSDAGMYSLITMLNVFTLFVILVMAYATIASMRAEKKGDICLIAYNNVRLRIYFYLILAAAILMFVCLPLCSYLFGL